MQLLPASVKGGVVYIGDLPASDVVILAGGESDSTGRVLISESQAVYIVDTQPDLVLVINQIKDICDQLITIGNYSYVIGAQGQVNGQPLLPVANASEAIKQYLEGFRPL